MSKLNSVGEVAAKDSRIELPDCFDFSAARELLRKIRAIPQDKLPDTLRIDCRRTRYIDTAGLGCLLLLGEHLGRKRTMRIEGADAQVSALLAIARIEERLAGTGAEQTDLRPCAECAQPIHGRCDGTLAEAADCSRTQPRRVPLGRHDAYPLAHGQREAA